VKTEELINLLSQYKLGKIDEESVLNYIRSSLIKSLDFAQIDYHRELRQGLQTPR